MFGSRKVIGSAHIAAEFSVVGPLLASNHSIYNHIMSLRKQMIPDLFIHSLIYLLIDLFNMYVFIYVFVYSFMYVFIYVCISYTETIRLERHCDWT